MAGNVKVGGNVIATHTGVEGAGTVTLSNVTASAVKMSSSGNTITDSAGNAVLSESSGTVNINKGTIGSAVSLASATFPSGHIIQTTKNEYSGARSATTTSTTTSKVSDGSGNNYWSHTISGMTAGNDVLVHMLFNVYINRASVDMGGTFSIYRDNTTVYHAGSDFMFYISIPDRTSNSNPIQIVDYIHLVYLDTGATGTSHTYTLGYSSYGATPVQIYSSKSGTLDDLSLIHI